MRVTGRPIDIADLRRSGLFSELAEDDLARLANWFVEWEAEADEVIVHQGDPTEAFFLVCKGQVELYRDAVGEPIATLAHLQGGDCFGELGIFGAGVRAASARAETACRLLRLGKSDLLAFLRDQPDLHRQLQENAARRHSASVATALELGRRREVRIRMAHEVGLEVAESSLRVRIDNISLGGLCLTGAPPGWREDSSVRFGLKVLGTAHPLPLAGRIIWRRENRVGVALERFLPNQDMLVQMTIRALLARRPDTLRAGVSNPS